MKCTIRGKEREGIMRLQKFSKKKTELRVYGYDNFSGDKGVIIANNYGEAVKVYRQKYNRKITDDHNEYMDDGRYLFDIGIVEKNKMYINTEW